MLIRYIPLINLCIYFHFRTVKIITKRSIFPKLSLLVLHYVLIGIVLLASFVYCFMIY